MSYGSFNATVTDSAGNAIAATITVTNTDGDLIALFSDAGTTGIANPYSVTDGAISFYCESQAVNVSATDGSTTRIWNDVVIIDSSIPKSGKTVTVNFDTDADITLTDAQNQYGRIVITDTSDVLTTERQIIVDADERFLTVKNETEYDVEIITSSGAGVSITQGQYNLLCDGTDILPNGPIAGSNSNGTYILYESGIAEMYVTDLSASFSGSSTADVVWAFPYSFINSDYLITPSSTGGNYDFTAEFIVNPSDSSYCNIIARIPSPQTSTRDFSVRAIGRWK